MSGARSSAVAGCLKACVARFVMILRAQVVSLFSVGPTVRPTGGTPASPAFLDGLSDGPPTPVSVGPTVRPTGGTPASPAFLDGLSDGTPTPPGTALVGRQRKILLRLAESLAATALKGPSIRTVPT